MEQQKNTTSCAECHNLGAIFGDCATCGRNWGRQCDAQGIAKSVLCPHYPHGFEDAHANECPLCDGTNSVQWALDALASEIQDARSQGDSERAASLAHRADELSRALDTRDRATARRIAESL